MRKPIHPASHGKKPEKTYSKSIRLTIADFDYNQKHKVSLQMVIDAWNIAAKDHESQGHRIIEYPAFDSDIFYGSSLSLSYTYEWDNLTYDEEKAAWDAAHVKYEEDLAAWNAFEEERKKGLAMNIKNIDMQIVRAEHRLANLLAVKDRKPIPYPEG